MARLWTPDWPPASADDKDDEFADASFDTGAWTEWDPGSKLTVTEVASGLRLVHATTAGADSLGGVFKAVPAGDYAIWTKVSLSQPAVGATYVGLLLGQDLTNNPNTSDAICFFVGFNQWVTGNGHHLRADLYTAYNTSSTGYVSLADVLIGTDAYLRIRHATTTIYFDFSSDGIGWQQVGSTAEPFTPAEFGLVTDNYSGGVNICGTAQFFRCVDGTPALTDVMNGQRVL